jgi:hypothetical protein
MNIEHPEVVLSTPDTAAIWRYMTFARFRSVIESKALFFARADQFDDWWEGVQSPKGREIYLNLHRLIDPGTFEETTLAMRRMREFVVLNCWHANEYESDAMWRLYGPDGKSVAIRSTIGRLKLALAPAPEPVLIGDVRYIDYDRQPFPGSDAMTPFFRKRMHFEHEREVRAVHWLCPGSDGFGMAVSPVTTGMYIETDLSVLIDRIYVAPRSTVDVRSGVKELCDRLSFPVKISNSELDRPRP